MSKPISIYLSDATLQKLDSAVEQQAATDRARGYVGRQVTSRSKLIERIIDEHFNNQASLSVDEIQRCVTPIAQKYGARKVSLFGSFARQEATPESDVDLLLEKGNIRGLQVLEFQNELERLLGRAVDVVTTAGASERFLNKIKKDEVVIYAAS